MTYEEHLAIGFHHHSAGRAVEAEDNYRAALHVNPEGIEAKQLLALILNNSNRHAEALPLFEASVNYPGNEKVALLNLGDCLRKNGQAERSVEVLKKCLEIAPQYGEAHVNIANSYMDLRQFELARQHFRIATEVTPQFHHGHNGVGASEFYLGNFEAAIPHLERALAIQPDYAKSTNFLLYCLIALGRLDRAASVLEQRIPLQGQNPVALHTMSLAMLTLGNWKEGWRLHESRLYRADVARLVTPAPLWTGQPAPDDTLMLSTEQGLGDTLQFIRYATLCAQRVGKVVVRCQTPLISLVSRVEGVSKVVDNDDPTPEHDRRADLMSMAHIFETTPQSAPFADGYLRAAPDFVSRWASRIPAAPGKLKVGLVWAGSPTHDLDRFRSIPLAEFAPLANDNVQFFSLQVGRNEGIGASPLKLIDLSPELKSYDDTAAAILQLDLVITVDSSVAHLAAGLGKDTWVLLGQVSDWRWMTGRTDTPWYSHMRLFRQKQVWHWADVMQQIKGQLDARANTR